MGKTIRLTEDQIRRFFGEGFGKRLIGEGVDTPQSPENVGGRALHQGFLNKSRVEFGNTGKKNDSNGDENAENTKFKQMAVASMRGLGKTRFDYNTMYSDKSGNGINEVLNVIFDVRDGDPINILDLLEILHTKLPEKKNSAEYTDAENKILSILDGISIDYLLSGFVGIDAPDYVYHRLKNLTLEDVQRIKTKFGKDFRGWGKVCDGCGGKFWSTTVPTASHDEAYTVFDFAATDTSNAGHFVKESYGFAGGNKPRQIAFGDIMQIHHINGNPGDNSAYNLACLCPNCHACIDSTGRGRETVFSVDSIMGNANIKNSSLNSRLRGDEIERIENTLVDRINNGYFSDRTVANMILNGGKATEYTDVNAEGKDTWVRKVVDSKLENMAFPGYARRLIEKDTFGESLIQLLTKCIEVSRSYSGKDKFGNLLVRNNVNEEKKPSSNSGTIVMSKNTGKEIKLSYSIVYDANKGGVLLQISRDNRPKNGGKKLLSTKIVTINELGSVVGDYRQKSNIVDEIIETCVMFVNEMVPDLGVNFNEIGHAVKNDKEMFAVTQDEKAIAANKNLAKSHANQTTEFNNRTIGMIGNLLTANDKIANNIANNMRDKLGNSLVEYLLDRRKNMVGGLGKTEMERNETIRQILRDGGYNA